MKGGVYRMLTMQVMKKQVLWKILCQFRKEVPYNNR